MAFSERTHQTRVGSRCQRLLSDMVQGSGIGPTLFLSYINELAEILERRVLQLNYLPMTSNYMWRLLMTDAFKLHNALDLLTEWANMWQLSVSVDTCCVLGILLLLVCVSFTIIGQPRNSHFLLQAPQCPWSVRKWFSRDLALADCQSQHR